MAQATIDPAIDPANDATIGAAVDGPALDNDPDGKTAMTDDVLSKLAGEEIDNLLAEAESGRSPKKKSIPPSRKAAPAAAPGGEESGSSAAGANNDAEDSELAAQLDPVLAGPKETPAAPPSPSLPTVENLDDATLAANVGQDLENAPQAPPAVAAEAGPIETADDAALAAQLNEVLDGAMPAPAAASTETTPTETPAPATDPVEAEEARLETLARELEIDKSKSVTDAELGAAATTPAPAAAAPQAPEVPLPMWAKPLVWINLPMSFCSDAARGVLGKAAILTFLNAAIVLAYIFFFARNH